MTRGKLLEWQVALENRRAVERPVEAVRQRLSGLRVLVAEDNEINQEVARSILEHEGARVTVAGNGREAIELVGEQRFDAVLMDLQMPEIDGYEAARRLRALPGGNALPILAMTANATPEDRERCRSSGMCEHVAKPIDVDHLVACIRRHASFLAGERA